MTPQGFAYRVGRWQGLLAPLGLAHWEFTYCYDDDELEDHKGRDADACVRVHSNYDTAHWHVKPSTLEQSENELDLLIVHELMHVALRDLNAVEFDMLGDIGGRVGEVYGDRLESANEQIVERLARAIVFASKTVIP